ncbi:MAG: NusG domain II-containing protein [Spirochaetales bacterium]|nr:NusG domain II-containing protein [Spirochaetales bacterium]
MKRITILDIIIILIIAGISVVFVIFSITHSGQGDTVHIDTPTASYEYPLNKDQTLQIQGSEGITVVVIQNKTVRFVESPCPGKTCIGIGAVNRSNIPIICLPNRVSAYITGKVEFDAISR